MLVDDHELIRRGVRSLLQPNPDMEVVAETGEGADVVSLCLRHRPQVVLMDITLPGKNGLALTSDLAKECPEVRVVILSMHADQHYYDRAKRAGAYGYVMKNASSAELEAAIQDVVNGQEHFPELPTAEASAAPGAQESDLELYSRLTPREREVLQRLAQGQSAKQIALDLKLSVKTVETHRANLMGRLGINNLAGVIRFAVRLGLVSLDETSEEGE